MQAAPAVNTPLSVPRNGSRNAPGIKRAVPEAGLVLVDAQRRTRHGAARGPVGIIGVHLEGGGGGSRWLRQVVESQEAVRVCSRGGICISGARGRMEYGTIKDDAGVHDQPNLQPDMFASEAVVLLGAALPAGRCVKKRTHVVI